MIIGRRRSIFEENPEKRRSAKMTPQKIKVVCPKCGANVDLSEAIQDELLHEIEERVRNNVEADRAKEISELQTLLEEKSKKLKESEKNELGLLKREQELEEKAASVDLVIAKQLAEERQQIAKQARETALEESHLKIKEYDIKMAGLTEQLNEMRRKVEGRPVSLIWKVCSARHSRMMIFNPLEKASAARILSSVSRPVTDNFAGLLCGNPRTRRIGVIVGSQN
jgi:hypothetical protein